MLLLLPIAFGAGLVTALTPCILPVLPIVLAGGGAGGRRRPYAIVAGLVTTFTALTLAATSILDALHLGANALRDIAVAALIVLAATLVIPRFGELLERPFAFLTRRRAGDLGGGFLLGASLGIVFVPCAGPVFGVVSTNAALHHIGTTTVFVTLCYALGAAIPMLLLAAGGRTVVARVRANAPIVRAALGVVMIVGAIAIYEGWETSLQTKIPSFAASVQNAIENNGYAKRQLTHLRAPSHASHNVGAAAAAGLGVYGHAPPFYGIAHWLNTPHGRPLTLEQLRGKVVLVDFWTYSCINCLRTLPHLEAWYRRYHSDGLEIVGVHTPEFAFEHDLGNVTAAAHRLGVTYPVALDNDYATWNAYGNDAWPADFLVDQAGLVRGGHIGEGQYGTTEGEIRALLAAGGHKLPKPVELPDNEPTSLVTPETYLGYIRLQRNGGDAIRHDQTATYVLPRKLAQNEVAYGGAWRVGREHAISLMGAAIGLHFVARDVYIVLGGRGTVQTSVDGKSGPPIAVNGYRLYTALQSKQYREGTLRLRFPPGIRAYSFTFG